MIFQVQKYDFYKNISCFSWNELNFTLVTINEESKFVKINQLEAHALKVLGVKIFAQDFVNIIFALEVIHNIEAGY